MRISIAENLRSFRRSWVHHTGMQLATLSVLSATFTVVVFVAIVSINLKRLLTYWGESVQVSVYLQEGIEDSQLEAIRHDLSSRREFKSATYVSKESATETFRRQMESYAPDLLEDSEFTNPFPASFQLSVNEAALGGGLASRLEDVASAIKTLPGVEDVSFGQGWVRNYSAFVGALSACGMLLISVLIFGSLFVVGNSVRASIAARRDEIEILELVGATSGMIRTPFVFEGALTGAIAAAGSIALNFVLYLWEARVLESTLTFSRLMPNFTFLGLVGCVLLVIGGTVVGAFGAWVTVRNINDGWSASQRLSA